MKQHPTLPTKRESVRKGILKRLNAVTKHRKQRVAATAMAGDFATEIPGRKIGMALAVIVGVHVVAGGLVFFHSWRLEGRNGDAVADGSKAPKALLPEPGRQAPLPVISPDDKFGTLNKGENWTSFAKRYQVDEAALRAANGDVPLQSGMSLKLPPKEKVITPVEDPEVAALRNSQPGDDRGNIEIPKAIAVEEAPTLVRPRRDRGTAETFRAVERPTDQTPRTTTARATAAGAGATKTISNTPKPSGRSHTVKSGDSLWGIAAKYKVSQSALMKANGITDAKKLKIGANLAIPN